MLLLAVSVPCYLAVEYVLQAKIGSRDIDGQFTIHGRPIRPYVLPERSTAEKIRQFEEVEEPYLVPDRTLGWRIGANARSENGLYASNSAGIRSPEEFRFQKSRGVTRIAFFGDSFVHGDDVPFQDTWEYALRDSLERSGHPVEILNFGVGGYGNDQAYLRWKVLGEQYSPDIVVIGFQAENCKRNLNVIRKFYIRGSSIPFSKPRFVLQEDGELLLVNSPTVEYTELPEIVRGFEGSNLRDYEYFYNPADYRHNWFTDHFKLFGTFLSAIEYFRDTDQRFLADPDSPEMALCSAVIEKFVQEASAQSEVFLVHLPQQEDVQHLLRGRGLLYEGMLMELAERFHLIDPADSLVSLARESGISSAFIGHYSPAANRRIGDIVSEYLQRNSRFLRDS